MKELITFWIVAQLIVIGWGAASIHNELVRGTYQCIEDQEVSRFSAAVMPLVLFTPYGPAFDKRIAEYCDAV